MEETWLDEFRERALQGRCDLAVDIGANCGEWTAWMAEHFKVVVAIEPDPRAFDVLSSRKLENVVCINGAVADVAGTAVLHMRESPLQSCLLKDHPIGIAGQPDPPIVQEHEVTVITLDQVMEVGRGEIDFVKMDIEGAEAAVLPAASDKRWLDARWLIECHNTRGPIGEFLGRVGFENIRIQRHPHPDAHPEHFWVYAAKDLANDDATDAGDHAGPVGETNAGV